MSLRMRMVKPLNSVPAEDVLRARIWSVTGWDFLWLARMLISCVRCLRLAEQRLSCDSSGEHEIWKCSFVHPLLHAEHSLFSHPLLNLVQELYQLSRGTTDE